MSPRAAGNITTRTAPHVAETVGDEAGLHFAQEGAGGDRTFNGVGKDLQPGNKIDYLFVSPAQDVKSHKLVTDLYDGLYPSDHFPVVVEVTLRGD